VLLPSGRVSSLAGLGIASTNDLANINSQLQNQSAKIQKLNEGVAMAFAMAGVPTVLPNETVAFTGNWGNFEGANGFSAAGAVKIAPNVQLNGGVAAGTGGSSFGSRVGVRVGG
jgi:hypothetical protein